jgi:hypothetical protein
MEEGDYHKRREVWNCHFLKKDLLCTSTTDTSTILHGRRRCCPSHKPKDSFLDVLMRI